MTKKDNDKIVINIHTTEKKKKKRRTRKTTKKKYVNPVYNPMATSYYTGGIVQGGSSIPLSSANIPKESSIIKTNKAEYNTNSIINPVQVPQIENVENIITEHKPKEESIKKISPIKKYKSYTKFDKVTKPQLIKRLKQLGIKASMKDTKEILIKKALEAGEALINKPESKPIIEEVNDTNNDKIDDKSNDKSNDAINDTINDTISPNNSIHVMVGDLNNFFDEYDKKEKSSTPLNINPILNMGTTPNNLSKPTLTYGTSPNEMTTPKLFNSNNTMRATSPMPNEKSQRHQHMNLKLDSFGTPKTPSQYSDFSYSKIDLTNPKLPPHNPNDISLRAFYNGVSPRPSRLSPDMFQQPSSFTSLSPNFGFNPNNTYHEPIPKSVKLNIKEKQGHV